MNLTTILHEIFEAKQVGTIYHYTDFNAAIDILKDTNIQSSIPADDRPDIEHPRSSISFTRNKNFTKASFGKGRITRIVGVRNPNVRFTFDGDKISNKYKIEPFVGGAQWQKGKPYYEAEERISMNREFNLPIKPYATSVDILLDFTGRHREDTKTELWYGVNRIIQLANRINLDVNWVDKNGNPVPVNKLKTLFGMYPKDLYVSKLKTLFGMYPKDL